MGCKSISQKKSVISPLTLFSPGILIYPRASPISADNPPVDPSIVFSRSMEVGDQKFWASSCALPGSSSERSVTFVLSDESSFLVSILDGDEPQVSETFQRTKDLYYTQRDMVTYK